MGKFSLKETKVELEQLFNSNEEEKYLALGTEFMRASFRKKSNHPYIINLIVNFFDILKENHNNFEKYFTIALAYIGILAYYNHHFNLSINCNYLALVSRKKPSATFYHNIALSMEALDLFSKAKDYYEKAIETLEQDSQSNKYKTTLKAHYQLNYVSSLINLNEITKAQNLIKTIDKNICADEYKNFEYAIKVETIRLKLISHPEYPKWKNDVRKIKELILKMDMPSEILNINNTILKLPLQLEEKYLSKLLKQNYQVSKKLSNPNIQRKAIYDLIEFYVVSKNKKSKICM